MSERPPSSQDYLPISAKNIVEPRILRPSADSQREISSKSGKPPIPPKSSKAPRRIVKRREKSGIAALDRHIGNGLDEPEEENEWDLIESDVDEERNGTKGTSLFARGVVDRYKVAVFRKSTPPRSKRRLSAGVGLVSSVQLSGQRSLRANLKDESVSSNASPSTRVANSGTVGGTANVSANTDDQPGPQDDPVNPQSDRGQLGDPKNIAETEMEPARSPLQPSSPPVVPQAPTNCFSREAIVNEILDLTDQVASTALYGSIGVGKSVVALAVLHHDRTKAIFGRNRHFMHYNDLTDSPKEFLERLSEATGASRTADTERLRSHLESSPPRLLVLDGIDSILDPLAPGAEEISAIIEELGCNQHVCLITTSRIYPDIHGFHRIEIPTLTEDGARETFYNHCNLGRSPEVDDLIARLDFHPLSIELLAHSVRDIDWDATSLLQVWDDDRTSALRTNYRKSLKETLEVSLRSLTILNLGTTAQDVLRAIAAFPGGIEESRLGNILSGITGVEAAVDVLCRFSLIYRQDGFVKMLLLFRFHFLDSMLELAQEEETIRWGPDCHPAKAVSPVYRHLLGERLGITKPTIPSLNVNGGRNRWSKRREDDQPREGFWDHLKRTRKGSATSSRHHTRDSFAIDTVISTEESPASSTHSNLGDDYTSSGVSPSTRVANPGTVGDTVDAPTTMDNRPGPEDDPIDLQSDEEQFWDFESMTETGEEPRWGFPLFVFFVSLFAGVAIA